MKAFTDFKNINGYITFTQLKNNIRIDINIDGLNPNYNYELYIDGLNYCCIYFNIELCKLKTNPKGEAKYIFYDDMLYLYGWNYNIIGKYITIYENNNIIDYSIIN
jgi:hypothetical protein